MEQGQLLIFITQLLFSCSTITGSNYCTPENSESTCSGWYETDAPVDAPDRRPEEDASSSDDRSDHVAVRLASRPRRGRAYS